MPEIVFLTELRPLVTKAADWLVGLSPTGRLDFRDLAMVVPTAGAGRRLREELFSCGGGKVSLPRWVTPLALIDLAVEENVANRQERLAAWSTALARGGDAVAALGFNGAMQSGDLLGIADSLMEVCSLLAEAGRTPMSEEVDALLAQDEERWRAIRALYQFYLKALAKGKLTDPNEARLQVVAEGKRPPGLGRVVVGNVADLRGLARQYLAKLEEGGIKVHVLVDAPDCEDARFDAWGCPDEEYWAGVDLPVALADVAVTADAFAEAKVAGELLADGGMALCLADEAIAPVMSRALARRRMASFDPQGESLAESEVAVLVNGWLAFCASDLVTDLRILTECPAFQRALGRDEPMLGLSEVQKAYDALCGQMLIDFWKDVVGHDQSDPETAQAAFIRAIEQQRKEFAGAELRDSVPAFLGWVYAEIPVEDSSPERLALKEYHDVVERFFATPIVPREPAVTRDLFRDAVREGRLYEPHADDAVELNGWLEAAWLPQARLVVTGCAEGVLPAVTTGHPFLPESARKALGLATNGGRLARDAFFLHNLFAARAKGAVKLIYARQNAEGEPAKPSRLLFRCSETELIPRIRALFQSVPPTRTAPSRQQGWKLEIERQSAPTTMRVTAFADYLACPVRFYLKHVLRVEEFATGVAEMDALEFGIVFHYVVEAFAKEAGVRDSTDAGEIDTFVSDRLEKVIFARHGRRPSLPVRVQQESLRARLRQFARVQAEERAAGWKIVEAEYRFLAEDTLTLGGLPVTASLDRVEIHEETGRRRILDYKTFARDKGPEETHFGKYAQEPLMPGEEVGWQGKMRYWKNLQLPLYRALAEFRWPDEEPPSVGYFLMPERLEETQIVEFPLDEATRTAALQCAEALAERVRRGIFWPPREVDFDGFQSLFLGEDPAQVLNEESILFLAGDAV